MNSKHTQTHTHLQLGAFIMAFTLRMNKVMSLWTLTHTEGNKCHI